MTLARAALGELTLPKQVLMVLGGALAIAIAAQISVPMFPVPMTLQTLAVLLVGLTFGAHLATATLLVYLGQGAMGLPVFANGGATLTFFGPTAGFLLGFVLMAGLVGFAADRGWTRGVFGAALVCLAASALLYVPGVAWPMAVAGAVGIDGGWVGLGADRVWAGFMAPFLLGDAVKAVLAALIAAGGMAALFAKAQEDARKKGRL